MESDKSSLVGASNVTDEHVYSDNVVNGDDDASDNYEDVEAKLQQERIEYLQNLRKRELEDAAAARRLMQDELLEIQREEICRVIRDEELARRLQEEEQVLDTSVNDDITEARLHGSSIHDGDGHLGETNTAVFDNAVYFAGPTIENTCDDEMLARALQDSEQEAASRRLGHRAQQSHDAYLAHIMQNTERIRAMRQQLVNGRPPQTADVHQQMSVPSQSSAQQTEVMTTPEGATAHRSQSATARLDHVASQTEGGVTSTTSTQGSVTPATGKRHKAATRKRSCKQQ